jgi:hypothetical protein
MKFIEEKTLSTPAVATGRTSTSRKRGFHPSLLVPKI